MNELTINKKIDELMKEKISITSTVGIGTAFILKFPAINKKEINSSTKHHYYNKKEL